MFRKLFGPKKKKIVSFPPIAPDEPFAVIGDVHGRADLLEKLLKELGDSIKILGIGDYIDRGEDSVQALLMMNSRKDIICLKGNHEKMMLDFLRNPLEKGPRWLKYGGLQTLAAFDVEGVTETTAPDLLIKARDHMMESMGEEILDWFATLPTSWQSGNVAVVHAGADPALPIDEQSERTLVWGHPEFGETPREDGVWVVHGHTIVDQPVAKDGIISIDTGAYVTGRLTAAIVTSDGVEFVST